MKKQLKTLIFGILIVAILAVSYFVVESLLPKEE